jgi:hypothetical protein
LTATIQGNCTINGNNNRITLEDDGVLAVASGAQLTLKNVELAGVSGNKLSCVDDTASICLKNCMVLLGEDAGFDSGWMEFEGDVVFSGDHILTYSSAVASTIASQSKLTIDQGTTFYYAPTVANRDLLAMTDRSSILYLNGCTFRSTATGVRLTKGRVLLDSDVTFSCLGTASSESISFGDGTAVNDVDVTFLSGAQIEAYGGVCYDNVA